MFLFTVNFKSYLTQSLLFLLKRLFENYFKIDHQYIVFIKVFLLLFREKTSRYYISEEIYSGDLYPPFCHGGMTVISQNHLTKLYETSLVTEKGDLFLEDVYIYGILRFILKGFLQFLKCNSFK